MQKVEITFKETQLIVTGHYDKGSHGCRDMPPEAPTFEIQSVYLAGCDPEQADVTELLSNQFEEIEEQIFEQCIDN